MHLSEFYTITWHHMALVSACETDRSKPEIFLSIQIPETWQDQVKSG